MATKKKGSQPTDMTARILASIRDDLLGMRADLQDTANAIRAEIAQVKERLDRLELQQTNADVRVATELTALIGAIGDLKSTLVAEVREVKAVQVEMRADGARMNALEARLARLEAKAS